MSEAAPRRGGPVDLRRQVRVIIAAQTVVLLLLFWRGSWYADDFQSMAQAQQARFDWSYVNLPVFGHPTPGMRALDWLLVRVRPMDYHLVAVLSAATLGTISWLLYCVLNRLFRPSPALLVLSGLPAFSAIWLPPVLWWAAATEMLGCGLSAVLCCYTLLRCVQAERLVTRIGWGIGSGAALGLGLLFYERSLLGALFAGLFVLAASARRLVDVPRVLGHAWAGYLAIGLVASAYLRYYFTHGHVRQAPGYTSGALLAYFWRSWSHTLVPGVVGGPLRWQFVSNIYGVRTMPDQFLDVYARVAPPWWWVLLTEFGVLAAVWWGFRRNGPRSLLGWLIFVPVFVVAQCSIATARLTGSGPGIGDEPRYVSDLVPLAVLALGVVLLHRPDDEVPAAGRRARRGRLPAALRPAIPAQLPPAVAVLTICWLVFAISAVPVSDRWADNRSKSYLANLRRSLRAADDAGEPWSLYDTPVPNWLVPTAFVPYDRLHLIGPLAHPGGVSIDDASRRLLVVAEDGTARPARFTTRLSWRRQCAPSVAKGIMFTAVRPLANGWYFLRFDYDAPQPSRLTFVLDGGRGLITANGDVRQVHGRGRLLVALRQTPIIRIGIRTSSASLCVSNISVGSPEPERP